MGYREIEKSIIKSYRKEIWSKFVRAIKEFDLIKENDKIAVCISGGKDSFLLAKCMQELKRHGIFKFDLVFLAMNPGYKQDNINLIKENAQNLNVPIQIYDSNIFDIVNKKQGGAPCYLCARMRRGNLYAKALELGCNKIALGHHFNDVIETIMLNLLYTGQYGSMMPKLKSDNFKNMELIRPLYFVYERDIINWVQYNNLNFIDCACKVTKREVNSKRLEIKQLINDLRKYNKDVELSIYKSSTNVNLNTIISCYDSQNKYNFLDKY